eukprot:4901970-Amphidinium_carterae.1
MMPGENDCRRLSEVWFEQGWRPGRSATSKSQRAIDSGTKRKKNAKRRLGITLVWMQTHTPVQNVAAFGFGASSPYSCQLRGAMHGMASDQLRHLSPQWVHHHTRKDGLRIYSFSLRKLVESRNAKRHVQVAIVHMLEEMEVPFELLKMRCSTRVADLLEVWCDLHEERRDMLEFVFNESDGSERVLADHDTPFSLGWIGPAGAKQDIFIVRAWMLSDSQTEDENLEIEDCWESEAGLQTQDDQNTPCEVMEVATAA